MNYTLNTIITKILLEFFNQELLNVSMSIKI